MTEETMKVEVLKIVSDPIQLAIPATISVPKEDRWQLVVNMLETMKQGNGIGLAANQVGYKYRVFVMDGIPPIACFNPRIVDVSEEQIVLEEGCLSFPHLYVKVKRPKHIKVRYEDADGEVHTAKLTGMSARIFQHELDHLDGIKFYDKASRFHRDSAMRRWRNKK